VSRHNGAYWLSFRQTHTVFTEENLRIYAEYLKGLLWERAMQVNFKKLVISYNTKFRIKVSRRAKHQGWKWVFNVYSCGLPLPLLAKIPHTLTLPSPFPFIQTSPKSPCFLLVYILHANCVSRHSSLFLCCLLWSRPNLLADCLPRPNPLSLSCLLWSRPIHLAH